MNEVARDQAETLAGNHTPDTLASSANEPDTQLGSTQCVDMPQEEVNEFAWSTDDTEDFDVQPSHWRWLPVALVVLGVLAVGVAVVVAFAIGHKAQKATPAPPPVVITKTVTKTVPVPVPPSDKQFLAELSDGGITSLTPKKTVAMAYGVCYKLETGESTQDVEHELMDENPDLTTPSSARLILTTTQSVYCPNA
jgi:Protein of unknown function (DUF732)